MEISDKLAFSIYTIVTFHIIAVLLIIGFTTYIILKAKKTPLLFSYLSVVSMLTLWMVSKILKTVSSNESIRWFFIVTQYFGVHFLSVCLLVFAYIYTQNKIPRIKSMVLLALPSMICFMIVVTDPWHRMFYSYYDFYRDRFGVLFLPTQIIQYAYLIIGILMLSRGFTHQPALKEKKLLASLFAIVTLIPLLFNIYYIIFKLTNVKWIFSFPVFDFTPISCTITLILFMIPAMKYRFLDISPISYQHIFDNLPEGIVFSDRKGFLYGYNQAFETIFKHAYYIKHINDFFSALAFEKPRQKTAFLNFVWNNNCSSTYFLLALKGGRYYKVHKKTTKNLQLMLFFKDMSPLICLRKQLSQKNVELENQRCKLEKLAQNTRELAVTKTKTHIAQSVHDILGHSLTVVMATADLAAIDYDLQSIDQKLVQIKKLLHSSVSELKDSIRGKAFDSTYTTLIKAISSLENPSIHVDFISQGAPHKLNTQQTEAIFRLCQEAVTNSIKHGKANTLHIILRFKMDEIEVYLIDDGVGCQSIKKNMGLGGIEKRLLALGGNVHFGSDGGKGFYIHACLPKHH